MKKFSHTYLILLVLAAIAAILPIFGGYFISFLLLLWLARHKFKPLSGYEDNLKTFLMVCRRVLRPIFWGAASMFVLFLIANLVANGLDDTPEKWSRVFSKMSHFGVKYLLLPYVIFLSWQAICVRSFRLEKLAPWLCGWFVLHTIYLLAQRQWGIDWTHGFDAVLGPHRFAYDVYRISGFMGHPLTLAYGLCIWVFATWAVCRYFVKCGDRKHAFYWGAITVLCAFSLLISGSRFPLAIVPVIFVLVFGRALLRHVKILAPLALAVALFLWWEGSLVGRLLEPFHMDQDLAQRFPRVFFWRAHWNIFLDHPLAGAGVMGLAEVLPAYYHQLGYHDKIYSAHNVYLQFLADSGLIGFAGLCSFLAGFAVGAYRLQALTGSRALWCLWLVAVLAGFMQNVLRDSEFLYALWLLTTLVVVHVAHDYREANGTERGQQRKPAQDIEPHAGREDLATDLPG